MLGLRILPFHSAPSCLKKLVAQNCDIESLPDNLFHYNWEEVDLMGNKGKGEQWRVHDFPKMPKTPLQKVWPHYVFGTT